MAGGTAGGSLIRLIEFNKGEKAMKNLICISVLLCLCSFAYCQGEGVTGDYSKTDFRGEFDLTDPASEKLDVLRIGYDRGRNAYTFKIGSADDVDGGFTPLP